MKLPPRRSQVDAGFGARLDQAGARQRDLLAKIVDKVRHDIAEDPTDRHSAGTEILCAVMTAPERSVRSLLIMALRVLAETDWRRADTP